MPTTCPKQTRWAVSHGHSWIIATAPDQTTCLAKALLNSPSKLVIRQTLLGRSTSRLRATGPGAFSSRFSSQLPSFASVRRPSGVTLSCGQAGNTPERPGSRAGKRVGLTATVTATWLRRDRSAVNLSVQLAPSTDCHGLWDRPGPDLRIRRRLAVRR
jgi:hypothetical protein